MIRDLSPEDMARLRELHAGCGLQYDFPNLDSPLFIVKKVVVSDGQVEMAAVAKLTVEVSVLCNEEWLTPAFRLQAFAQLHEAMRLELMAKGMEEVIAFIPPQKEKSFARRLGKFFGWGKANWNCYSRKI